MAHPEILGRGKESTHFWKGGGVGGADPLGPSPKSFVRKTN